MPDLVGLKQSEAEKILKDYDVTINKTVFKELSDDYKKGLITKTDPVKKVLLLKKEMLSQLLFQKVNILF